MSNLDPDMGTLVISYDCEGIWGMLDQLDTLDKRVFNRFSLFNLYQQILNLHEKYDIRATFAFVGAFVGERRELIELFQKYPNAHSIRNWCEPLLASNCSFNENDAHIPELLELINLSAVNHEIASHGYTHVIMDEELDEDSIDLEVAGARQFMLKKGLTIKTMIFPRNVVNSKFLDRAEFILAFRAPPKFSLRYKLFRRISSLMKEFVPICRSEQLKVYNGKVLIPGDFFINWRNGLRRFVPVWLTVWRFRMALAHACRTNGIVHIWLHPHNLLTGQDQMQLLEKMLFIASEYKKNSSLKISTQSDFTT